MPELYEINKDNSEKKGYVLLKEDCIRCANCNKKLLEVIKVKEVKEMVREIKVNCPYCGDSSFLYRITGVVYTQAPDELSISDMPVDILENVIKMNVEVIKNVKK